VARVYLGLGSNVDAERNLRLGIRELRWRYGDLDISPVYRSRAVGFEGDDFLNLVVGLETEDAPEEIHRQIEIIHELAGRERGRERFASRTLDIDLLLYDDLVCAGPPLKLPRPDVLEYAFVLKPLADLDPELLHPQTGRAVGEHWRAFDAASQPLEPVSLIL
jgi:2-amino-4-hydroxy-6-hydroxymethyldihydropteridine diphosphokinase